MRSHTRSLIEKLGAHEHVRGFARVTWGLKGFPLPEDHLWLESQVNERLAARPAILVCAYDLGLLPGTSLIHGGLETHAQILIGGRLQGSPAFVEPSRYVTDRLMRLPWLTPPQGYPW